MIAVVAVISPGPWGTRVAADIGLVFVGMAAVADAQTIMLRYRSHRTDAFVLRNLRDWDTTPLPGGSLGLSRRSDFWLATGIASVVFAVMLYASIPRRLGIRRRQPRAHWPRSGRTKPGQDSARPSGRCAPLR